MFTDKSRTLRNGSIRAIIDRTLQGPNSRLPSSLRALCYGGQFAVGSTVSSGENLDNALFITLDQSDNRNVVVQEGIPFWVKWTTTYSGPMDFYYSADGLYSTLNSTSNYSVYQPDGVTPIDLSTSGVYNLPQGSGPDPLGRETLEVFINYFFQSGQTYYLSFTPLISGPVGVYVFGD